MSDIFSDLIDQITSSNSITRFNGISSLNSILLDRSRFGNNLQSSSQIDLDFELEASNTFFSGEKKNDFYFPQEKKPIFISSKSNHSIHNSIITQDEWDSLGYSIFDLLLFELDKYNSSYSSDLPFTSNNHKPKSELSKKKASSRLKRIFELCRNCLLLTFGNQSFQSIKNVSKKIISILSSDMSGLLHFAKNLSNNFNSVFNINDQLLQINSFDNEIPVLLSGIFAKLLKNFSYRGFNPFTYSDSDILGSIFPQKSESSSVLYSFKDMCDWSSYHWFYLDLLGSITALLNSNSQSSSLSKDFENQNLFSSGPKRKRLDSFDLPSKRSKVQKNLTSDSHPGNEFNSLIHQLDPNPIPISVANIIHSALENLENSFQIQFY
ncbi:hypothetical protein AYI68_g3899 [Smittium mucronatum]|uniref:Uncharacterized protein n=1 Tax=Smittium mucronatum TaxID=133383 RepID=A0A1R0GYM4_9FUNG|nr:hypothetical protein AYI68_g3899 [Smittium mucronatum]